jgi:hypothetical protein
VFFRSQSFSEAIGIFQNILSNTSVHTADLEVPRMTWVLLLLFIVSDVMFYNNRFDTWVAKYAMPVRWGFYSILIFSIIVFSGVENFPFIYFQF